MDLSADAIKESIPFYLTEKDKESLVRELKKFDTVGYYVSLSGDLTYQGDGWSELGVISYETGERKQVRGIVLSNTCDIDPRNERDTPANLLFAPIVKLKAYGSLLERYQVPQKEISDKFNSIRKQHVTTLFYLPQGAGLEDEYIALLDDIHSIPLNSFLKQAERTRLFSLSLAGFYGFILKLSVHFCRFSNEGVSRSKAS